MAPCNSLKSWRVSGCKRPFMQPSCCIGHICHNALGKVEGTVSVSLITLQRASSQVASSDFGAETTMGSGRAGIAPVIRSKVSEQCDAQQFILGEPQAEHRTVRSASTFCTVSTVGRAPAGTKVLHPGPLQYGKRPLTLANTLQHRATPFFCFSALGAGLY